MSWTSNKVRFAEDVSRTVLTGTRSYAFHHYQVYTGIRGGGDTDTGGGNTLTNREVLLNLDPRRNSLPYIYDTFAWEHCEADGYHFDDAWPAASSAGGNKSTQDIGDSVSNEEGLDLDRPNQSQSRTASGKNGARVVFRQGASRYPQFSAMKRAAGGD